MPLTPGVKSIDLAFQVLALKLLAIIFEKIFHFNTFHAREGLCLEYRINSTFAGVPVNQLPAYAIKLGVISFAKLSLLVLFRENTDSLLQILFHLVALSGHFFVSFRCLIQPCTQLGLLTVCRLDILLQPMGFGCSARRRSFVIRFRSGSLSGFSSVFLPVPFFPGPEQISAAGLRQLLLHAAQRLPLSLLILIASHRSSGMRGGYQKNNRHRLAEQSQNHVFYPTILQQFSLQYGE